MKLTCFFVLILLAFSSPALAQSFLSLDDVSYRPGEHVSFTVYASETILPDQLRCRLITEGKEETVIAVATAAIADGELIGQTYQLALPEQFSGTITLSVFELEATPVMFMVTDVEKDQEDYPTLSSLFGLAQPYIDNISAYEPIYFLVGTNPEKSKFQFSFKYRLVNPKGLLNKNMPWLQGLHIAFTQTSFWDLKSESTPFEDTSYKPEFFFLSPNTSFRPSGLDGLFFQLGYQHESNGRAEPESRSTNYLYLESFLVWYNERTRIGLGVAPKIWTYIGNDNKTNPDLSDYRGYLQIDIRVGKADGLVLGSDLRWAKEGASIQADLTYPVHQFLGDNLEIYLHLQYVNALAESLINYQDRTEAFRIGFSVVR